MVTGSSIGINQILNKWSYLMIEVIFYFVSIVVVFNLSKELERDIFND